MTIVFGLWTTIFLGYPTRSLNLLEFQENSRGTDWTRPNTIIASPLANNSRKELENSGNYQHLRLPGGIVLNFLTALSQWSIRYLPSSQ